MSKVVVNMSLTLDGVTQAPGRPDEDTRGGFTHGGWALPYFDPAMGSAAAEGMAKTPALLFGRRTYEDFYNVWPKRTGNPFTEVLNNLQKYVASTTLEEPLPWNNSALLKGDSPASRHQNDDYRRADRDLPTGRIDGGEDILTVQYVRRTFRKVSLKHGPGCFRKDLPGPNGVRVWVDDMVPGSEWPYVDEHEETGEQSIVISGEVIEGDERYQAGTYLYFAPGSSHRPRTEIGARLFGFNIIVTPDRERPQ